MLPIVEAKISTEEFQITDWATQIAELQARIAASQQRINQLNEDNAVADGLLQAAQDAKGKISDQEVIADLLAQLSHLFSGGDGNGNGGNNPNPEPQPNDDGGNYPLEPAPQPNDDGGAELAIAANQEQDSSAVVVVDAPEVSPEVSPEPEYEPDFEKQAPSDLSEVGSPADMDALIDSLGVHTVARMYTEVSSDLQTTIRGYYPGIEAIVRSEVSEVADHLASDFQEEVNARGLIPATTDESSEVEPVNQQGFAELIKVSDAIAYMRKFNGEIMASYIGSNNRANLESLSRHLGTINQASVTCIIREQPKRLVEFRYEAKILGLSNESIQRLLALDLSKPVSARLANALLETRQSSDEAEIAQVELNQYLEEQSTDATTDWKARAKELGVSIDNVSPGHYVTYHGYRKLGEVIEKHDADSLYYVNRNQRTMLNVGNGDGQKYATPQEAAIGLAKFLKVIKDAEESKADLFGGGFDVPAKESVVDAFGGFSF